MEGHHMSDMRRVSERTRTPRLNQQSDARLNKLSLFIDFWGTETPGTSQDSYCYPVRYGFFFDSIGPKLFPTYFQSIFVYMPHILKSVGKV